MSSNRAWMYKRLEGKFLCPVYVEKLEEFISFACGQDEYISERKLRCSCAKCRNVKYIDVDTVKLHLYQRGFLSGYHRWTYHGEELFEVSNEGGSSTSSNVVSNPYMDMVFDALRPQLEDNLEQSIEGLSEEPPLVWKEFFDMLNLKAAEKPVYNGCEMSLLEVAARVINLKCEYNMPFRCVEGLTSLIKDICLNDTVMAETFYTTRKLLSGLELPHHKIDVCPNGCMLFWEETVGVEKCSFCDSNRNKFKTSKGKLVAHKKLMYLPITPRLQRLYLTQNTASQMNWHAKRPQNEGLMCHPSDGEAWKHFDGLFPSFSADPRNVRLGHCTDGFSPFRWVCTLTPYNLPPWLCMSRQFLFLSLVIPGLKSPKGNIDVYLQPLEKELKQLWDVGALTYDVSSKQNFVMKAALMWTISDFPAYGMLSGWSTAGRLACPYCMENTKTFTLSHGRKQTWFDCYRQFLCKDHAFCRNRTAFYAGRTEVSEPPKRLTGAELWERVREVPTSVDVTTPEGRDAIRGYGISHNWTKQSVFWTLPYWKHLLIRHNLDVMHIEKNVFDNVIHTVMNVKGITKDNVKSRKDLELYCKRQKLHVQVTSVGGSRMTLPVAEFALSRDKRRVQCEWVQQLKFPDGYASNIGRFVNKREYKLFGMKSHDCHVFMGRLLPIALHELLPSSVWQPLAKLSLFFRDICSTELRTADMEHLERDSRERYS